MRAGRRTKMENYSLTLKHSFIYKACSSGFGVGA